VTQGLVCAFSTLEPCRSFTVAGNRDQKAHLRGTAR